MVLGIILGAILRKYIWIAIGIVGVVGGFYFGALIALFVMLANCGGSGCSGSDGKWMIVAWSVIIGFTILGGLFACKCGQRVVLLGTSFFGSFLFVEGINYIVDDGMGIWEVYTKRAHGIEVTYTAQFYISIVVLVCLFIFSASW